MTDFSFPELLKSIGSRIPVIVGPTAVGKTAFGIKLAQRLNGEIISVDSRQIYQDFIIGTSQPTVDEQRQINHHLISILDSDVVVTAGDYAELVKENITQIRNNGKTPVLVGGTLLYVQSICFGIIDDHLFDEQIRSNVQKKLINEGNEKLYAALCEIDPEYAKIFHPNDLKRLARAYEILESTGKTPSKVFAEQQQKDKKIRDRYFIIALQMDREQLYHRIEDRVEKMIIAGWLDEVEQLINHGAQEDHHAMQSVGYKQLWQVVHQELSLTEAVEIIKQKTRQFAKRQLTWLKKMKVDIVIEINSDD